MEGKVPDYKSWIKRELPSSSVRNKDIKASSYQAPRQERALCTEAGLPMLFRIIAARVVQALEAVSLDLGDSQYRQRAGRCLLR